MGLEGQARTAVTLTLTLTRRPPAADSAGELATIPCQGCGGFLEVSHPDMEEPELLLGVCETCHHWFALGVEFDSGEILICRLLGAEFVRASLGPPGCDLRDETPVAIDE